MVPGIWTRHAGALWTMNHQVALGSDAGRHPVARGPGQMTSRHIPVRRLAPVPRTTAVPRVRSRGGEPTELFVRVVGSEGGDEVAGVPRSFVFLHGLGGTGRYWTADQGRTHLPSGSILVDLFGFGRSPRPFTRYTLETHLATLGPVLAGRAPFVLVGHSLGAALAAAYAARHPDNVEALVLISLPAFGGRRGAIRWLRHGLRGWFLTNMVLTAMVCVVTRRLLPWPGTPARDTRRAPRGGPGPGRTQLHVIDDLVVERRVPP